MIRGIGLAQSISFVPKTPSWDAECSSATTETCSTKDSSASPKQSPAVVAGQAMSRGSVDGVGAEVGSEFLSAEMETHIEISVFS